MIYPVILLGFILRLISLDQSLWWDEAINVVFAQETHFWDFVTKYPVADFHPPGYFAILWVWGRLFGFSEISVRLPSVFFGVLTIFFTYKIGQELFSKKTGLLSALFLSIAPLSIYYSQEARMYSFAAFAVCASSYFFIRLLKKEKFGFFWYAIFSSLVLYSDYVGWFIFLAHLIWVVLYHKKDFKRFFGVIFVAGLSWLPFLPVFLEQLGNGQKTAKEIAGWGMVVGGADVRELLLLPIKIIIGKISFENNLIYLSVVFTSSIPFFLILVRLIKKTDGKILFLMLWLLVPTVATFLVSVFIPVFSYFRLIFILPAFYLLTAFGIGLYKGNLSKFLLILVVLSELGFSFIYLFNVSYHREDWKGLVQFLIKQNYPVVFEDKQIPRPVVYYAKDVKNFSPLLKNIPAYSENDLADFEMISDKKRIFLVEYLVDITDPKRLAEKKLKEMNFNESRIYNFRGVGFVREYIK